MNKKQKELSLSSRKRDNLAFIAIASIFLNIFGGFLAKSLHLPLWLDTIGTCVCAYFANLPLTLLVGISQNLFFGFFDRINLIYAVVGAVIALCARYCAKKGFFDSLTPAMIASFVVGVVSIFISAHLDLFFNSGYTGNPWADAFYDMLRFKGFPKLVCAIAGEAIINIVDKQFTVLIAYFIIKYMLSLKSKNVSIKSSLQAIILAIILAISAVIVVFSGKQQAQAEEKSINFGSYVETIYNNTNGLSSTGINMISETPDGYIWIGGYAGLTRYDGTRFEYLTEGGISNVTALFTDGMGNLWIGTNDNGIFIYNGSSFRNIRKENGLTENSIRTITQAKDGTVYIGTTGKMCKLTKDNRIIPIDNEISHVRSLCEIGKDVMAGVDYSGNFFIMRDGEVTLTKALDDDQARFTCVMFDKGKCYIGTTSDYIIQLSERRNSDELSEKKIYVKGISDITNIEKDSKDNIWVCSYNGAGILAEDDRFYPLQYKDFNSGIQDLEEDYEGNLWFASTKQGVMKLSSSAITDLYSFMGFDKTSVNAVTKWNGYLYCGTDHGLDIIDPISYEKISDSLTELVGNTRIRSLMVDSKDRLWVCCYGKGLACQDKDGKITYFNKEDNKTSGNHFRCLLETKDGGMVAGCSDGMTFIENDKVVSTLDDSSGLETPQILTLASSKSGDKIYAGSDGSGIYIIEDGKVTGAITEKDGLSSLIILRLIPYNDGFFVVTSNSLSYMEDDKVRKIESFPYYNNFDVVFNDDEAWVLSSCGIFVAKLDDLLDENNSELIYELYDAKTGLRGSITANSWQYVDENNNLYFCSNAGVQKINMNSQNSFSGIYKMQIASVKSDGKTVPLSNGKYLISAEADDFAITPTLCNYNLDDLKVRFYVEGLDTKPITTRQSQLSEIVYRNVPHGSYKIHLQILDNMENVIQEQSFPLIKEAKMWENAYYQFYLFIVSLWMVAYGTWVIIAVRQTAKRRKELEQMKVLLEEKVKEQTSQIVAQSKKMEAMQWNAIESMAALIEDRDGNTGEHVKNTRKYVNMIARELQRENVYSDVINDEFIDTITAVAPLHDVGKIRISDTILNKPGRFTDEEYEIMKTHSSLGGQVVRNILGEDADPYLLENAQNMATYHHERWDGKGYPEGKKGEEIPLCSRIMSVADVFDALVSKRVYKDAFSIDSAYDEITKCSGTQFEPCIVDAMVKIRPEVEEYLRKIHKDI